MKVTDYIVQFLFSKGISSVFELSGGMIMQLLDSFYLDGRIKIVSVHHEQSASFAADAMGRMSGKPGVAIATSGPGATNLITGIGSCYFDSVPAVFITGQVNRHEQKDGRNIRQAGFQETDIVSIVSSVTKYAYKVTSPEQVPHELVKAFRIANEGRPGPVVIDIPMDIFRADIEPFKEEEAKTSLAPDCNVNYSKILDDLQAAERPIILAGNGINASGARKEFRALVDQLKIPVVNSLLAVDILPYDHSSRTGMIGTYGNRWSNISLYNSDFVLVIGSRLDIRQTGADTKSFKGDKIIYQVDCEEEEINNRVKDCIPVVCDIKTFISGFIKVLKNVELVEKEAWINSIELLKAEWPDTGELKNINGVNPNQFMHDLSNCGLDFSAYIVDVGQHQMWAAQSVEIKGDQRFLTSGGMGAMGYALPASIGASFSDLSRPVCVIAGDAGFQLNIQELQTIVRNELPVKIVVINNRCHGMTRQFQETYFKGRYQSTIWGYSAPDFVEVAHAYGIESFSIAQEADLAEGLEKMASSKKPFLLEVMIDTFANAYPKMAFGLPMSEMEPYAKPLEMEGT